MDQIEANNSQHIIDALLFSGEGPNSPIRCVGAPPPKPEMGSYSWNGVRKLGAEVEYSCGPYGTFAWPNGSSSSALTSQCLWNQTWSRVDMPDCKCKQEGVNF